MTANPIRRQKIAIAAEVYGVHYDELTALQQQQLLEIIACKSLEADELNNITGNEDTSDEELDRQIRGK